jgi:hypothetical protein
MLRALPDHVIDFANPEVLALTFETRDPALVDQPYQSRSFRHFVARLFGARASGALRL